GEVTVFDETLYALRRTVLATATTVIAVALCNSSANAQATYTYTGKPYTFAIGSFTTSQRITATLQLSAWLPPKSDCVDVSHLPGFRLIMDNGVQSVDSASFPTTGFNNIVAAVSTDANGQIVPRWILLMTHSDSKVLQEFVSTGATSFPLPTTC